MMEAYGAPDGSSKTAWLSQNGDGTATSSLGTEGARFCLLSPRVWDTDGGTGIGPVGELGPHG
jgi:hypothetical protein